MNYDSIIGFFSSLTLGKLVPAILIIIAGIFIIKGLLTLFDRALQRSKLEKSLHGFLRSTLKIVLYALLVIIVAGTLGINVTSLVAVLSVVSLAVSLAVQGTLSNLAGGIQVLTAHPFKVGDFVEIGGISGTVREIGLVYTVVETVDNKNIYVPNSDVSSAKIINYTSQDKRRVDLTISASYDAPVETVKAALVEAAGECATTFATPAIFARVSKYGDNAIEYTLRVWTATESYWDTYFDVLENVKKVFDARGIAMTYPHVNVHMVQE
jgi:small conductance mechanosensitive channel